MSQGRRFCTLLFAIASLAMFASVVQAQPANPGLEDGELGEVPRGWWAPPIATTGFTVELTDAEPRSGERCGLIHRQGAPEGRAFGNLMQAIDAEPYRGQRIRFRAAVRIEPEPGSKAQLWLRVDRAERKQGFFDNMRDRPIVSSEWQTYDIVGEIADDAQKVNFGLMLLGGGRAYLDDVEITVLGRVGEGNAPARALTERGLDNLVALSRLLGYVRYFHPSDEAADLDWDTFSVAAVDFAEAAADAADLAARLEALVQPMAPSVECFSDDAGKPPPVTMGKAPAAAEGYRVWYHLGVGAGSPRTGSPHSTYASERLDVPLKKADEKVLLARKYPRRQKAPRPGEVRTVAAGGVACRVPLALYYDSTGTLPRPPSDATSLRIDRIEGFSPNPGDRSVRLAAVALGWNVFQHFYPYFDVVPSDWYTSLVRSLKSAATDRTPEDFAATLDYLVADLHDGHGSVHGPGSLSGPVGLPLLWDWIEDRLVVTAVADGVEGVQAGDVVRRIDGRDAGEALDALVARISGGSMGWRRYKALALLLSIGPTRAGLEILPFENGALGEPRTLTLERSSVIYGDEALRENPLPDVHDLEPGILYVNLDRIDDAAFQEALPRLEKARGIVFDLRGYPKVRMQTLGHLIDETITSNRWRVPIVTRPDREGMDFRVTSWNVAPQKPRLRAKVAYLIDGRAISRAETYLAMVEHYGLGELVGSPTAGTNGNVNPFTLLGGYNVMWTGMKVLKHDGTQHHRIGIRPTLPIERTIAGVAARRDEVLEAALERLR